MKIQRATNSIIVERLEYLIDIVRRHVEDDKQNFDKLDNVLDGNGHAGLKMRVDRLEVSLGGLKWAVRAFWIAALGAIASYLGGLLK